MHTDISREELYDNFATKDYLRENFVTKEYLDERIASFLADIRTLIHEIGDSFTAKIQDTDDRLDRHIEQNALEHNKFKRA